MEIKKKTKLKKENKINFFTPILMYLYFLLKYILKKKSTIIYLSLIAAMILLPFILVNIMIFILEEKNFISEVILQVVTIGSSMVFIFFFGIYATLKAIDLFRSQSEEGVEILIISKPIERWQIIFSRYVMFFSLFILAFIISTISLAIGYAIIPSDFRHSINFGKLLGGSILSGFLSYLLFGSISIIVSMKLATMGTMIISISILLSGFILSTILEPISTIIFKTKTSNESINFPTNKENPINNKIFSGFEDENIFLESNLIGGGENSFITYLYTEEQVKKLIEEFDNLPSNTAGFSAINYMNPISSLQTIFNTESDPAFTKQPSFNYLDSSLIYNISNNFWMEPYDWNYSLKKEDSQYGVLNENVNLSYFSTFREFNGFDGSVKITSSSNSGPEFIWLHVDPLKMNSSYKELLDITVTIIENSTFDNTSSNDQKINEICTKMKNIEKFQNTDSFFVLKSDFDKKPNLTNKISINSLENESLISIFYFLAIQTIIEMNESNSEKLEVIKNKEIYKLLIESSVINTNIILKSNSFLGVETSINDKALLKNSNKPLYRIIIKETNELMPLYGVILLWGGISLIVSISSILIYNRKDFS